MSETAFRLIRDFVHWQCGVNLGPEKDYLIESRLHGLLRQHALPDLDELAVRLRASPTGALSSAVISAITTHETSWFRDERPFERLRKEVFPRLRENNKRRIRLWSAACSTGQEAYSIAMLLHEEGFIRPNWDVSLLASDLCELSLAQAERGRYSSFELARGLPAGYRDRFFRRIGDAWEICPAMRDIIDFQPINLIRMRGNIEAFDIIFCRNVLIYFDQETQLSVMQDLHDRLQVGGFLFLGAAESPVGFCDSLRPYSASSGLYCRT